MVPQDLRGRDERTWHASMPATPYVKPGDNVMVPDLDRAKIDARSLHAVIVDEYSNDQFKLGTSILIIVWNKISKIIVNLDI